jgi:hypothetical protein
MESSNHLSTFVERTMPLDDFSESLSFARLTGHVANRLLTGSD